LLAVLQLVSSEERAFFFNLEEERWLLLLLFVCLPVFLLWALHGEDLATAVSVVAGGRDLQTG